MTETEQVRHALNGVIKAMGLPNEEATDEELADLVWLTHHLTKGLRAPQPVEAGQTIAGSARLHASGTLTAKGTVVAKQSTKLEESEEEQQARLQREARYRRQSHITDAEAFLPALGAGRKAAAGRSGQPLMLPAPPALENKTALARSLRPLKRRVPSRTRSVIDEAATVLQIAEADTWFPVLRPLPEKWLDVVLLIDRWNTMAVWHRMIAEFRQMLADVGVFQQVTVYSLETKRTTNTEQYRAEIHTLLRAGKRTRQIASRELANASGRRLFLVVTDGMSPIWQSGAAAVALEPLCADNYLALVDVLPSKLWEYSGLGHASLTTVWAGWHRTANRELRRLRPWYLDKDATQEGTPLPVMSLTPASVGRWAQIVAGETTARMPSFVLPTEPSGRPAARDHWVKSIAGTLVPEKRLEYFDEIASPLAWILAGQLAAVYPLSLPVMRLIQQFHLPKLDATHLAEIFHAGLLRLREGQNVHGDPELMQYDFQPGLRTKLRSRVSGAELFQLLQLNARYFAQQHGNSSFQAVLRGQDEGQQVQIDADSLPFAKLMADVLRELGKRYEREARIFQDAVRQYESGGYKNTQPQNKLKESSSTTEIMSHLHRLRDKIHNIKQAINEGAFIEDLEGMNAIVIESVVDLREIQNSLAVANI